MAEEREEQPADVRAARLLNRVMLGLIVCLALASSIWLTIKWFPEFMAIMRTEGLGGINWWSDLGPLPLTVMVAVLGIQVLLRSSRRQRP